MADVAWLGPPIDVRPLFGEQQVALLDLLRQLSAGQWDQPTICPGWTVKDIAAHVLGDFIGVLSRHRDGYPAQHPRDGEAFPVFLDRINGEWVTAARRMSPLVLTGQLSIFGDQITQFWQAADPDALGGAVSWAGPEPAPVWLDAAREFSEYWTHHQQICDATGQPGLVSPRYLGPVLDTFMRALPHTLRAVSAPPGTSLEVTVTGPAGGTWRCTRDPARWRLERVPPSEPRSQPAARLELDPDTAWRLCTRGITPELAGARARTDGDRHLTGAALQIVSIIWSSRLKIAVDPGSAVDLVYPRPPEPPPSLDPPRKPRTRVTAGTTAASGKETPAVNRGRQPRCPPPSRSVTTGSMPAARCAPRAASPG